MVISLKSLASCLVSCLAFGASAFSSASHFVYVGTTYPIRWGASDNVSTDTVSPYPVTYNPVCFKVSSSLGIQLVSDPGDPVIVGWEVQKASLVSNVTGHIYWSYTGPSALLALGATFTCPGTIPNCIDDTSLNFLTIVEVQVSGGGGANVVRGYLSPSGKITLEKPSAGKAAPPSSGMESNDIYSVLSAPTAPMATPWVTVLDWACTAAVGQTSQMGATDALTSGLFGFGHYDPSQVWWTVNSTDSGEGFYPNKFLQSAKGQCNDFADFLVCASNAVAGESLKSQRSCSESQMGSIYMVTNSLLPAGGSTPAPFTFAYHQFTDAGNIWDGAVMGFIPQSDYFYFENDPISQYETEIVDYWIYGSSGNGAPSNWYPITPFTPTVCTAGL